jgi:hypothetical protein
MLLVFVMSCTHSVSRGGNVHSCIDIFIWNFVGDSRMQNGAKWLQSFCFVSSLWRRYVADAEAGSSYFKAPACDQLQRVLIKTICTLPASHNGLSFFISAEILLTKPSFETSNIQWTVSEDITNINPVLYYGNITTSNFKDKGTLRTSDIRILLITF